MNWRRRRTREEAAVATPEAAPAKSWMPRVNQTWLGLAVLAVLLTAGAFWVIAGNNSSPYNEAAITELLLDKELIGEAYARLAYAPEFSGLLSNETLVAIAFDNQTARQEQEAISKYGRIRGVAQAYVLETTTPATSGPVYFFSQIDAYRTVDGAHGHFEELAQRPLHVGEASRYGLYVVAAERFSPLGVGEGAAGQVAVTSYEAGALGQVVVYTTTVTFQRGRTIGRVGVDRADAANIRDEVIRLARELDQRLVDAQR